MSDYDNTNTGALFKNDKEGNEKRPDYKGKINVGGTDYKLSAWIKTSKAGNKFMSLQVEAEQQQARPAPQQPAPQRTATVRVDDEDGDIPF